jgi:hypothetical protein
VEEAFPWPDPNWTEEVSDIAISGFTYTVEFEGFTEPFILVEP